MAIVQDFFAYDQKCYGCASLIDNFVPLIKKGLSVAVYTQTTDVEAETNGLMTYDRRSLDFRKLK